MTKVFGVTQAALKLGQRELVETIMRNEYDRAAHTCWAGIMTGLRCEYRDKLKKFKKAKGGK